ncbi:sushi, von Willebrand factor type A, EGF and pentraxin domain-containing protein 1-like [Ruditapes philippinarum]|uniref:sushi, von Willebrand factor type A, EGF and pentraxin domain-containing protein 1-like n=1 Tax=Ruditapes philippinarum TaxID=129788 RepID=UPI00295C12B4|nr:sushi, von Willebrand factor type A, EGF and pentraxin domain-containing protein 1-like [Ruditapes philippinarum]
MCLSNGSWEKWTDCEIVDCGDPVPAKGSANSTKTTYRTVVEITCAPGYILTGTPVIECKEDETWTDYPTCDTADCGRFSVANGEVNTSLGTSIGSLATVKCDDGYDLQGSSEIICTSDGWEKTVSCQIQVCDDPTPYNGKITDTDGGDEFVFGNYVKIECYSGYNIEGDSVITCINGRKWSASSKCRLLVNVCILLCLKDFS